MHWKCPFTKAMFTRHKQYPRANNNVHTQETHEAFALYRRVHLAVLHRRSSHNSHWALARTLNTSVMKPKKQRETCDQKYLAIISNANNDC